MAPSKSSLKMWSIFNCESTLITMLLSLFLMGPAATLAENAQIMEIILDESPPLASSNEPAASMLFPVIQPQLPVPLRANILEIGDSALVPSGQCNIQVQVLKMVPGRCIRLGLRGSHGCVSGNHIVPFHRDCM